jgi:alkylhydroperoxidase family enzyme
MDEVLRYERSGLPEHQKVALRFTDAFLTHPASFHAGARAETLQHFSPAQIVELAFKLVSWTVNKSVTALGADEPIDEARLTTFDYDPEGRLVLHRS